MAGTGATREIKLYDYRPGLRDFRADVLEGLGAPAKTLPCKYFYDERGSRLFERICELDEYYLTRTELRIMEEAAAEMAEAIGPEALIVEYGSGSDRKIRALLAHLERPAAYVPVDISKKHLRGAARGLAADFAALEVAPVCADFTRPFALPPVAAAYGRVAAYFPGSTIGNFTDEEAVAFLANVARTVGAGGGLLVGVDLQKAAPIIEVAYNDKEEVTRDFNLNLLRRINEELGADFALDQFRHQASYDAERGRVEMRLVSRKAQKVRVGDAEFTFAEGESIHSENSHKYTLEGFRTLAARGGMRVERVWTDEADWFSVQYLTADPEGRNTMEDAPCRTPGLSMI